MAIEPRRQKRRYRMTTRTAAKAQTRERILEAGLRRFAASPYEEVTLQNIAADADVAMQTVLIHFGSKEGVLTAIADWWTPREVAARAVPPGDIGAATKVLVGRYEELGAATLRFLALEERFAAVARLIAIGREEHLAWVRRTFHAELIAVPRGKPRIRCTMALVAALDVYVWHVLRKKLGPDETARTMAEMVEAIIATRQERNARLE